MRKSTNHDGQALDRLANMQSYQTHSLHQQICCFHLSKKILDIISKIENVRNIKKLVGKPRLNIFKEITGEEDDNKSRLLEDIKELIEDEDNNDNNNLI